MSGKFLRSAAVYTISNIVNAGIPFLMLPILTRVLSPGDYGIVAMFATTVTILGAFTGLNVHSAIGIRYFEQDKLHLSSYIRTALALLLVSTATISILLWLGAALFESVTHLPREWLVLAALVSGVQFIVQIQLVLWQSESKPWRYGFLRIAQGLLDAGLSLGFIFLLGYLWQGRVGGQALAILAFAGLTLLLLYRGGWLNGTINLKAVKNLLWFGIPLVPHTIGSLLIALADRFMVANVLGLVSTGIYMAGLQLGLAMGLVADAFVKAFGPWLNRQLANKDLESPKRIVGAIYLSFAVFVILGLVFYGVLLLVFDWLLPQTYAGAKTVLPFFVIGNAFLGMYYAIAGLIFFSSQTYRISKITVMVGVLSVPLTYFLIQRFGILGAGMSYAVSQALIFALAWNESRKLFNLPWGDVTACVSLVLRSR